MFSGNTQARVPELPQAESGFHAKAGRGEITKEDVKLEPYVDITDEHGLTALHWAASYGQLNSCQDLVWCVNMLSKKFYMLTTDARSVE